jgi:hypothetical protein
MAPAMKGPVQGVAMTVMSTPLKKEPAYPCFCVSPPPRRVIEAYQRGGNDVLFADGDRRGYLWMQIGPQRLEARLQGYESVREETGAEERTLFTCALEDGRQGLQV